MRSPFRLRRSMLILVALGIATNVSADDEIMAELDETVVQADAIDNSAKAANEARQASLNAKTVIDAAQLNQFGDQPLGDALRRVAGVSSMALTARARFVCAILAVSILRC